MCVTWDSFVSDKLETSEKICIITKEAIKSDVQKVNVCVQKNICFSLKFQNGINNYSSVTFFCSCLITHVQGNCLTLPAEPASLGGLTRELSGINGGRSCPLHSGRLLSIERCLMKVLWLAQTQCESQAAATD